MEEAPTPAANCSVPPHNCHKEVKSEDYDDMGESSRKLLCASMQLVLLCLLLTRGGSGFSPARLHGRNTSYLRASNDMTRCHFLSESKFYDGC